MEKCDDKILQDFGISENEARKRSYIRPSGKANGLWECIAEHKVYTTPYEAVEAHFKIKAEQIVKIQKEWAEADLHVKSFGGRWMTYIISDAKTGEVLRETNSAIGVLEYMKIHPALKYAVRHTD